MRNPPNIYRPVSCSFYSQLELLALRKSSVHVRYEEYGKVCSTELVIADLKTQEDGEFLKSTEGLKIRLDRIKAIQKA